VRTTLRRRSKTFAKDGKLKGPRDRQFGGPAILTALIDWTEVSMLKALVPVDGSENSLAAVRHAIEFIQFHEPMEIHLLNVQPPLRGDVTAFVPEAAVHDYHMDAAEEAMRPACELFDRAGIAYTRHVFVGHAADVIAQFAHDLHCDQVIMGTHGYGTIGQLLHGSVSHEAIHRIDPHIAVTLVKPDHNAAA
jgi:nucleotide-binding universal stress UspA family protein